MRKRLHLLLLVLFAGGLLSQVVAQTGPELIERKMNSSLVKVADDIGDFTITDSDGVTHNLYDELDAGNTVFIDLFFTT
ncbi:MAG: hypothetical protein ACLFPE_14925 [Bacteroidales bacterium]